MRVVVSGSRNLIVTSCDVTVWMEFFRWSPSVILHGAGNGNCYADWAADSWAREHNILVEQYPAQWDKLGKSAGIKRNLIMAAKADAALVWWNGVSHGAWSVILRATKKNKLVRVLLHPKLPMYRSSRHWGANTREECLANCQAWHRHYFSSIDVEFRLI